MSKLPAIKKQGNKTHQGKKTETLRGILSNNWLSSQGKIKSNVSTQEYIYGEKRDHNWFRLANDLGNSFSGILENVRGHHSINWDISEQIQSGHFLSLVEAQSRGEVSGLGNWVL